MEITVKFSAPEYASIFRAWKFAKRQLRPLLYAFLGLLIAGWLLAGWAAGSLWADYRSGSEAGWITVWLLVNGAWTGLYFYHDCRIR